MTIRLTIRTKVFWGRIVNYAVIIRIYFPNFVWAGLLGFVLTVRVFSVLPFSSFSPWQLLIRTSVWESIVTDPNDPIGWIYDTCSDLRWGILGFQGWAPGQFRWGKLPDLAPKNRGPPGAHPCLGPLTAQQRHGHKIFIPRKILLSGRHSTINRGHSFFLNWILARLENTVEQVAPDSGERIREKISIWGNRNKDFPKF